MKKYKIGVSPGYFISKCGGMNFSYKEICECLKEIESLGFDTFQAEIVRFDQLDEWEKTGAKQLAEQMKSTKLEMSMFVCHFLGDFFSSADMLKNDDCLKYVKQVVNIVNQISQNSIISVPLATITSECKNALSQKDIYDLTLKNFKRAAKEITDAGHKIVCEIPVQSIVPTYEEMIKFFDDVGYDIGLNLDTGHPHADGLDVLLIPALFKGRIHATHICDNTVQGKTTKHAPGRGLIDWEKLIALLVKNGYNNSYDMEIGAPVEIMQREYKFGKDYLEDLLSKLY